MTRRLAAGVVLALLAVEGGAAADLRVGRAVLEENCGGCHAVGGAGDSAHPEAPPFRDVMQRYPASDLEESLAEGIVTGHDAMPIFEFDTAALAAVVAYLDALSVVTAGQTR